MNVKDVQIYRYTLPLIKPLCLKGTECNVREGFVLKIISDKDKIGYGEVSPLPGFSKESLDNCCAQMKVIRDGLLDAPIPDKLDQLGGQFQDWLEPMNLHSSVRFGLETAVLDLLRKEKGVALFDSLDSIAHDDVEVHGLLQGSKVEVIKEAQELLAQGYTSFKLKVGGTDINDDIKTVIALNEVLEGRALLKLDANQQWSINEAIEFGNEVGLAAVEYIEEPFEDKSKCEEFFMKTTIPIALDESLFEYSFDDIKSMPGVEILILKPTLLAGIETTWNLIKQAQKVGLHPGISSSFETQLGTSVLARLAAHIKGKAAAGLDTLRWWDGSIVTDPIQIIQGHIYLEGEGEQELNSALIKEMDDV